MLFSKKGFCFPRHFEQISAAKLHYDNDELVCPPICNNFKQESNYDGISSVVSSLHAEN